MNPRWLLISGIAAAAIAAGCDDTTTTAPTATPTATGPATTTASATGTASAAPSPLPPLAYLPEMVVPADNPLTKEKIELGALLFFDPRLGKDGKMACEGCHFIDKGWADALPLSTKADGKANTRHTPALINIGYQTHWYWDGRSATLEAQVLAAWKGQIGGDPDAASKSLAEVEDYKKHFAAAFDGAAPNADNIVKALASFIRSVRSGNAPFDKSEQGDKSAISESAQRGWEIFRNKAKCTLCHAPPLFTDNLFHNVGVGMDAKEPDIGRGKITKEKADDGKFKTPSLRSVTLHPPYFHDGSAATLEAAVDYMLSGGKPNDNLDKQLTKIDLSKEERADLIEFIKSLDGLQPFERPKVP